MQRDLAAQGLPRDVQLLGVNAVGAEGGNALMTQGRVLPRLQDAPWTQDGVTVDAWTLWSVTWRDVVILDADNVVVGVYNLTDHPLDDPANYAELQALLTQAAGS